jgi:hypothetical protein
MITAVDPANMKATVHLRINGEDEKRFRKEIAVSSKLLEHGYNVELSVSVLVVIQP